MEFKAESKKEEKINAIIVGQFNSTTWSKEL